MRGHLDELIELMTRQHNAAAANGYALEARRIARVLKSLEGKRNYTLRACERFEPRGEIR